MGNNYKKIRVLLLLSVINLCWQSAALAMDNSNPMDAAAPEDFDRQRQQSPRKKQGVMDNTSSETPAVEALEGDLRTQPLIAIEHPNNSQSSNATSATPCPSLMGDNPFEESSLSELNHHIIQLLDLDTTKQAALVSHDFYNFVNSTRRHLRPENSITDENLIELVTKYPNLTSLDLSKYQHITDNTVLKVTQMRPKLTELNLLTLTKITDDTLIEVSQNCPNLTWLNLEICLNITDAALVKVAQMRPHLKIHRFTPSPPSRRIVPTSRRTASMSQRPQCRGKLPEPDLAESGDV